MEQLFTTESLSFLAVALLSLGVAKFVIYYKSFNIEILKYIDPSEIIILFADNILAAAPITLAISYAYIYKILPFVQGTASTNCSASERKFMYLEMLSTHFITLSILAFIAVVFSFTRKKITIFERITYIPLSFLLIFILPIMNLEVSHYFKQLNSIFLINSFLIINFFFVILIATVNEIIKVKKKHYFKNTYVQFDNFDIQSNMNTYYVGMTKNYIFFYTVATKESTTYPVSKVKCIKHRPA